MEHAAKACVPRERNERRLNLNDLFTLFDENLPALAPVCVRLVPYLKPAATDASPMSKALSRALTSLDDATRAAVRRAAKSEGKSLEDWIDETISQRAQTAKVECASGRRGPSAALSSGLESPVAEIARRLQQRRATNKPDGLTQALAMAGRRLAEDRSASRQSEDAGEIAALRREIIALRRMTEAARPRLSRALPGEIDELLALLDDQIEAQRRAGVSEALLAPAVNIAEQIRLAVDNLDPATAIEDLRDDLDKIGRRLDELCGPNAGSSRAIRDLTQQVGGLREQVSRLSADAPQTVKFEAGLVELARHVCTLAESGALAQTRHARELEALSRTIANLVASERDHGVAAIRHQMTALVADFEEALDRAGQKNLAEIDARLRVLGDSLSQSLLQRFDEGLSRSAADTAKLQILTEALALKIDVALTEQSGKSDIESLGRRVMRIEEQVSEPRIADLVSRLDAMQTALTQSLMPGGGHRQTDLAQEIEKLAVRIDRALESQGPDISLEGLETQIGKLAVRLESTHSETLKMAETIARQAGEAAALATLEKGGAALRAAEQKETRETLRAVEEWLARFGDRFAMVEGVVRQLQETQRHAPSPDSKTPDGVDFMAHGAGATSPIPVVEALAVPMAAEALSIDTRATQAGFIAAARRAAQQAARSQWAQDAKAPGARTSAVNDGGFFARASAHRRPALIALAAIMLLTGAYQLTQSVSFDDGREVTTARDTTPPAQKPPVETAAQTPPASSKQASTIDPAPVGAIVNPGQSGIAASVNAAMALATLAANGDAAAQFELASRYADGRDIARDSKLAVLWFEKAAQQGLAPAQYRLGTLYEKGIGIERNETVALDWYRRAADAGNVRAMHNLAVMLAEGGAGKPDYAAAAVWFRKAADLGVRDSQYNLAILYARGLGVETSLVQSYLWFSAAAAQGDVDAAKKRDEVAARLGARDLETAKTLAAGFQAKTPVPAANDVVTPPGGWRAPPPSPAKATNKPKMSWFQSF